MEETSIQTKNISYWRSYQPRLNQEIYGGNFNTAEIYKLLEKLSTTIKPRDVGIYNTLLAKMNGKNHDIYSDLNDDDFLSINAKKQNVTFGMASIPSNRF